jgi:hypothetical protein
LAKQDDKLDGLDDKTEAKKGKKKESTFYFYQAADGQHCYLLPLDVKILKHQYKNYEDFPDSIEVKISNSRETTMDEGLRRRFKYLSHVPLGCDLIFIEIDFDSSDIVTPETRQHFSQELEQRKIKNTPESEEEEEFVIRDDDFPVVIENSEYQSWEGKSFASTLAEPQQITQYGRKGKKKTLLLTTGVSTRRR